MAEAGRKRRRPSWSLSVTPAALLAAQVALYLWMAPRGFEFTDESYYLLNYLHWRDLWATVTFFGAYLDLPFRLLGQSIAAIRVLTLVGLIASSAFFTHEALRWLRNHGEEGDRQTVSLTPFVLVGATASLFYFGFFSSVRAPSYNWLSLCAILVATALMLRLTMLEASGGRFRLTSFSYGVALGVCGLSKAPTGLLVAILHAAFFAIANRDWRARRVAAAIALAVAGVVLNVALLQLADPVWLSALREGVAMTNVVGHGGLVELAHAAIRDAQSLTLDALQIAFAGAGVVVLARNIRHRRRAQISIATAAVVLCLALALGRSTLRPLWLPSTAVAALVLWSFGSPRPLPPPTRHGIAVAALGCLLVALPLAFSFGTNTAVFEHSQMAAVLAVGAVLMPLQRLADRQQITQWALGASLAFLCVPTSIVQFQNTFDVQHAYRLRTALADQKLAVRIGPANARLLVDPTTRQVLAAIDSAARAAGLPVGAPILDLTGDGPGIVFALGGRPLGEAWLSGGYSGSERAAARLVARVPLRELETAWLLTSSDNPRRIVGWQRLLDARIGSGAHELVATIPIRSAYIWSGNSPGRADVDIWRPRALDGRAAQRPSPSQTPRVR